MASKMSGEMTEKKEKGAEKAAIPEESESKPGQGKGMETGASGGVEESTMNQDVISRGIDVPQDEAVSLPGSGRASKDKGGFTAANTLKLEAFSPGTWGNELKVKVDYEGLDPNAKDPIAKKYRLENTDLFNLTVFMGNIPKERFVNVSVKDGPRRVDRVLVQESQLVRISPGDLPASRPKEQEVSVKEPGIDCEGIDANAFIGKEAEKTGLYALEKADGFNLLCIPPDSRDGDTPKEVYAAALSYCVKRRAMLIVDPPAAWGKNKETAAAKAKQGFSDLGLSGTDARNAAFYFPRVTESDPLREGQLDIFVPCGIVAGVMARIDRMRGIWKAPAGLDASLNGIQGLQVNMTDAENGMLNPLGINCLRNFPVAGSVIWGARTLRGADQLADEYKYVPVRRLALYIEESLFRGLQWVVFEPNDEPLWAQIRLNAGAFMYSLFRQGAFQGLSPAESYFVKCDKETTTQNDIDRGIVNIAVGFAPLKPAEFVVIKIQQIAGKVQT
jgi:hypothetical protein